LTPEQQASLERGEAIVEPVRTGERRDVAVMGVIHVNRPRAEVVKLTRATEGAAIGAAHGFMHRLSTPATPDDFAALRLTEDDLKALSRCKQDACNLKLAAEDMARLRSIVDSAGANAPLDAESYFRWRLVELVNAYHSRGNAAMYVYNDRGSVHAGSAFDAMLADSCRLVAAAPELTQFLLHYPRAEEPGESSVVYWALDSLPRTHPTLRVMQEVMLTPAVEPRVSIIATKQLYANHYFEAGLEILAAVDDSVGGGSTVVILRHYRFDQLPRIAFIDLRGRVVAKLRDAVSSDLDRLRKP
jgi:hypothetical protein